MIKMFRLSPDLNSKCPRLARAGMCTTPLLSLDIFAHIIQQQTRQRGDAELWWAYTIKNSGANKLALFKIWQGKIFAECYSEELLWFFLEVLFDDCVRESFFQTISQWFLNRYYDDFKCDDFYKCTDKPVQKWFCQRKERFVALRKIL